MSNLKIYNVAGLSLVTLNWFDSLSKTVLIIVHSHNKSIMAVYNRV